MLCLEALTCHAAESPAQRAEQLVKGLPESHAVVVDTTIEQALVELGEQALPALERELYLGIRSRARDELAKTQGSRRYSVVRVLAGIQGERSTDMLVRSLSDAPDNLAMQMSALHALEKRKLSPEQIVSLVGNSTPFIAMAGLKLASGHLEVPLIKTAVERLHDPTHAKAQFHNENGIFIANDDILWDVRLATGRALQKDMDPEIRTKGSELLVRLKGESQHLSDKDPAAFMSYASGGELAINRNLGNLTVLGRPALELVRAETIRAAGDYSAVLDMALLRLGDKSKVEKVCEHLVGSTKSSIRLCAAFTLVVAGNRTAIPALRKALQDPYHRTDGSCLNRDQVYPVRIVAQGTLSRLERDLGDVSK